MSFFRENKEFKQEFKDVKDSVNEKKVTEVIKRITTSELQQVLDVYDAEKGFFTKMLGDDDRIKTFRKAFNLLPDKEKNRELTLSEAKQFYVCFFMLAEELGEKTTQFIDELNQKHNLFWYVINTIFSHTLKNEPLLQNDENLKKILQANVDKVKEVIELFQKQKILSQDTFNVACELGNDSPLQSPSIIKLFEHARSTQQFDLVLNNLEGVCQYAWEINHIRLIFTSRREYSAIFDGSLILKNADFAEQIYEASKPILETTQDGDWYLESNISSIKNFMSNLNILNKMTPDIRERIRNYPSQYTKAIINGIFRLPDKCPEINFKAIFNAPQNADAIFDLLSKMYRSHHSFGDIEPLLQEHAKECDEINKAANELNRLAIFTPDNLLQLFKNAKFSVKIASLFSYLPDMSSNRTTGLGLSEQEKSHKLFTSVFENLVHLESIEKELKKLPAAKIPITMDILQNLLDNPSPLYFKYIFLQGKHPRCEKSNVFKFFGKNKDRVRNHALGSDNPLANILSFLKNVGDQKEMQLEKKQTLSS